jgi:hypothetical protein
MVDVRFVRNRTGLVAAFALLWQALMVAAASAVISCDRGPALEHGNHMADCPMQKKEPACPLHAEKHGTHDCDCPSLGCSQTDTAFTAVFGTVGVLPAPTSIDVPLMAVDAAPVISTSILQLAAPPPAHPPRL